MPSEKERMAAFACGRCEDVRPSGFDTPSSRTQPMNCEQCRRPTMHTFIGLRMFLREFEERRSPGADRGRVRVQVRYILVE